MNRSLIIGLLGTCATFSALASGYLHGKQAADRWYASHPVYKVMGVISQPTQAPLNWVATNNTIIELQNSIAEFGREYEMYKERQEKSCKLRADVAELKGKWEGMHAPEKPTSTTDELLLRFARPHEVLAFGGGKKYCDSVGGTWLPPINSDFGELCVKEKP